MTGIRSNYHISKGSLALITSRLTKGEKFAHVQCTRTIFEVICMSPKTSNNGFGFPLYLYPKEGTDLFDIKTLPAAAPAGRRANLSNEFVDDLKARLKFDWVSDGIGDLKKTFGPENVFHYIYAVLHSPQYRKRYSGFLKIDFPRLPITSRPKLFAALCKVGSELSDLHLLEGEASIITTYPMDGDHIVDKVRYSEPYEKQPGRVWINATQYFEGIPKELWEFHIGGYQVCQKWLKDRKGRELMYDDQQHYQKIVSALARTIELMAEIDSTIDAHGGWPLS
jgi:predicted helicase